jgi:hypothetical protein
LSLAGFAGGDIGRQRRPMSLLNYIKQPRQGDNPAFMQFALPTETVGWWMATEESTEAALRVGAGARWWMVEMLAIFLKACLDIA